jgi:hypothetical protein
MQAAAITKALVAASANGVAASQTPLAAGFLTLTANPVVLDSQRRILVTPGGDDHLLTITIIGTDDTGNAIKDSFAGGNSVAVASNLDFKTVTSIYVSGATASTVEVGTNGVGASPWKLFADSIETPNMSLNMQLVSGAGNAGIQYTYDPIQAPAGVQTAIANAAVLPLPQTLAHPTLNNITASLDGTINWTIHAWRLIINSGTGTWKATGRQAGLASP